ncbi:hypothetical protein [Streptomyces sp. NPDC052042]|uniref:hypothetical protein n=1 Tax=Streptomyces sp. NPDC052042 TaxID=3365683 RepID=UPI0037D31296
MPEYRIISEIDQEATSREARGARPPADTARLLTVLEAESVHDALYRSMFVTPRHGNRRVISVEELHPGFSYWDEEITAAITRPHPLTPDEPPLIERDLYEGDRRPLSQRGDLVSTVKKVVEALRDSGLVPGLTVSVLDDEADDPYAMVEVYDDARHLYLAQGTEARRLTDDPETVGWDGILAIARGLIDVSNPLH